jgi:hypothetical protein
MVITESQGRIIAKVIVYAHVIEGIGSPFVITMPLG